MDAQGGCCFESAGIKIFVFNLEKGITECIKKIYIKPSYAMIIVSGRHKNR